MAVVCLGDDMPGDAIVGSSRHELESKRHGTDMARPVRVPPHVRTRQPSLHGGVDLARRLISGLDHGVSLVGNAAGVLREHGVTCNVGCHIAEIGARGRRVIYSMVTAAEPR